MIADSARDFGHKNVIYEEDKSKVPQLLLELIKNGDIVITMGAGDIWKYGEKFIEEYNNSRESN